MSVGILSFKDEKAFVSPWITITLATLLYAGSWLLWNRVRNPRWRRSREPVFTNRNPLAKLPPVREH